MQCPNRSAICVCLAVIVFFRYVESEATCDKLIGPVNNCHCRYSDGGDPPVYRDIDFSPLGRSDGKPAFGYKDGPNNTFKYAYNPCHPFTDEFCMQGTTACQVSNDEKQSYPIGNPDIVAFEVVDSDFVLTYAEVDGRLAVVNFHCDESALNTATYEPLGEVEDGYYHFKIGTCLACLTDVPNCQSSVLTPGGILCIVFAVLVLVYLVGGILFQTFGRGAKGKEVIPNYEFWADLPYLIKDGFMFLIGLCKRDSSRADYEAIK